MRGPDGPPGERFQTNPRMTLRKVILTPELVEQARLVYDAGAVSVDEIAAMLGIKRAAFFNFRKRHGWKLRRVFNHRKAG
jgi:predicted DNA-binding protein (UPF0251 family)